MLIDVRYDKYIFCYCTGAGPGLTKLSKTANATKLARFNTTIAITSHGSVDIPRETHILKNAIHCNTDKNKVSTTAIGSFSLHELGREPCQAAKGTPSFWLNPLASPSRLPTVVVCSMSPPGGGLWYWTFSVRWSFIFYQQGAGQLYLHACICQCFFVVVATTNHHQRQEIAVTSIVLFCKCGVF